MGKSTSAATHEELQNVEPTVGGGRVSVVERLEKNVQRGVSVRVLRIGTDSGVQVLRHLGDIAITRCDHDVISGAAVLHRKRGARDITINPKNCVTSMVGLCETWEGSQDDMRTSQRSSGSGYGNYASSSPCPNTTLSSLSSVIDSVSRRFRKSDS